MLHGDRIGRFELRDHLGRGGAGDVYLAVDPRRPLPIALKVLRIATTDGEMLAAEKQGLALHKRLHEWVPAIAEVYDSGEDDGCFWVAMEYVEGPDLSTVLQGGALPAPRAAGIALQLCDILDAIARASPRLAAGRGSVVHGDVKPQNIRLQDGDRVRLLDFGVAKSLSLSRKFTINQFGSTPYLSPERLSRGVVDANTDLWAVGVILYEMVTGRLPFPGDTYETVEHRIRDGMQPDPLPASCPPALKQVIAKCLAFDVEQRYGSPAALKADLKAFLAGRPVRAGADVPSRSTETRRTPRATAPDRQSPAVEKADPVPDRLPVVPPPRSAAPARRPRIRWWFSLPLVASLVLAGALAGGLLHAGREGSAIQRELAATKPTAEDLKGLQERYSSAHRFDLLDLVLGEPRKELAAAFVKEADRALGTYRVDAPTRRRDWERALDLLARASDLEPADDGVRARRELCEALVAMAEAESSSGPAAKEDWKRALDRLETATRLAPDLPEPYLAKAKLYANPHSGYFGVDRVKGALEEAGRRGFTQSDSGTAVLASALYADGVALSQRAEEAGRETEQVAALYQARDRLESAVDICRRTLASRDPALCRQANAQLGIVVGLLHQRQQY